MKLTVPEGFYEVSADQRFPFLRLLWLVVCHRAHHWRRGEGWSD